MALVFAVEEEALAAGGADGKVVCGEGLGEAVGLFEHALAEGGDEIFLSTGFAITVLVVFQTVNIILYAGLSGFDMVPVLALDAFIFCIPNTVGNGAGATATVENVGVAAGQT